MTEQSGTTESKSRTEEPLAETGEGMAAPEEVEGTKAADEKAAKKKPTKKKAAKKKPAKKKAAKKKAVKKDAAGDEAVEQADSDEDATKKKPAKKKATKKKPAKKKAAKKKAAKKKAAAPVDALVSDDVVEKDDDISEMADFPPDDSVIPSDDDIFPLLDDDSELDDMAFVAHEDDRSMHSGLTLAEPTVHQVGDEIDAYCYKCKRVTLHNIVSVLRSKVAKVICRACQSQHKYYAGESAKGKAAKEHKERGVVKARNLWEQELARVEGKAPVPYDPKVTFKKDDVVEHRHFGKGVVLRVYDGCKMSVIFEDKIRKLVHAKAD